MNKNLIGSVCMVGALALCASLTTLAADPPASPEPTTKEKMTPREKAFAKLLTGAVMEGTWRMTHFNKPQDEMKLGEHKSDRYEIVSAIKSSGEHWVITARIIYADRDVNLPVPVRVVWADDTPMITLTELTMPLLGQYSARVIFHHGFYSGVWYGAGYGGVMSGQVTTKKLAAKPTK